MEPGDLLDFQINNINESHTASESGEKDDRVMTFVGVLMEVYSFASSIHP